MNRPRSFFRAVSYDNGFILVTNAQDGDLMEKWSFTGEEYEDPADSDNFGQQKFQVHTSTIQHEEHSTDYWEAFVINRAPRCTYP